MSNVDILLVEDNEDHIFLTKRAMEKFQDTASLTLHVVKDGVAAMDFINKQPPHEQAPTPDLILLDIKLPNKNGFEVLANFKGDKRLRAIPIVMLPQLRRRTRCRAKLRAGVQQLHHQADKYGGAVQKDKEHSELLA